MKHIFVFCLFLLFLFSGCRKDLNEQTEPVNLKTEFLTEPLGIDAAHPRFTWEYTNEEKDFRVSKYEIKIGTSPENLKIYSGKEVLKPHTRYYWNVTVWDDKNRKCKTSQITFFETAKMQSGDWKAEWITDSFDKEYEPAPMFRKMFELRKNIKEARAYVASGGYYELFINGTRVGENYLDPGYTHFDKRILYVTHDITPLLKKGGNAVAAVIGNGWYNCQSVAVWGFEKARWRGRPNLLCEIRIVYENGDIEIIATDNSWKTFTGPYVYNNIYSGDKYDARLEDGNWKGVDYDDSKWRQAVVLESPTKLLVAQQMPGIHITEEVKPVAMKAFNNNLYVYTFPKNISGLCRLRVKGEAGTRVTMKYGELLDDKGRLNQGNIDVYYHPVKSDESFQTDVYILKGLSEEEMYMPSFSYHGFQYVEVESSLPINLTEESLTGLFMHTDVEPVGNFICSNSLLNEIWEATMLSYRCNLHSIPTDCPQREKNGWTADAHIAIDLGLLGFDGITLYEKWMNDFIDNQREDIGDISGIIPSAGWGYGEWLGPVWDAALFIIPDALYKYYGDIRCMENLYPTLERYLKYLETKEKDGYLTFGLGDWVYWKSTTNNEYTSTAYCYLDNLLMSRFANLLNKDASLYQQKADRLKKLINEKFFDIGTGVYAEGTQTAQALALYLGLVPAGQEQVVANKLREIVCNNDYFLDFGLLGSKTVPAMLAKYGYIEDAMKMLTKTELPSWGYWIKKGYTTLAETWKLSPQFQDASLNHVFLGDVSAWMMNYLAGINYDDKVPGFKKIIIHPYYVKDLDWVKGEYHSIRGVICSEWKRENGEITLSVTIPGDCTASIYADKEIHVGSGTTVYK